MLDAVECAAGEAGREAPTHGVKDRMKNVSILLLLIAVWATNSRAQQPDAASKSAPPVAPAPQVCVLGNVVKPSAIPIKGTISLMRAIGEAGGATPKMSHRVLIIRRLPDGYLRNIQIKDLKAVARGRATDILLQPEDIVIVSSRDNRTRIAPQTSTPCDSKTILFLRHLRHM